MKLTLLHFADLVSLILATPATLTAIICSLLTGGAGVGRHSALGCRAATSSTAATAATAATATSTVAPDAAAAHDLTVTASESALLAAFCCLQAAQILASAARLMTNPPTRLHAHTLTTCLLLVATASIAVNNPTVCLYSVAFALQFLALAAHTAGLALAVAICVDEERQEAAAAGTATAASIVTGDDGTGVGGPPVWEGSFQYLDTQHQDQLQHQLQHQHQREHQRRLPFVDEDDRLVYEFKGDGRLEWRLGQDRGGGGVFDTELLRHAATV